MTEKDLVLFQINRKFKNFGRNVLEKLQENHDYIKSLEQVLIKMGINEENYSNSPHQFTKDRKFVLDRLNDALRELEELIGGFDIKLQKSDINEEN